MCSDSNSGNSDQLITPALTQSIDRALLLQIEQGSERAMEILYDRNSTLVYRVALRILRDTAAAEDVVQDVFMRIWRSPERFIEARGEFAKWMAVVTRNCSIDALRVIRRWPSEPIDDFKLTPSFDLFRQAELSLLCVKAKALIERLPVEHQKLIRLAFFEGMSHSEIASVTGSPLGTIKTRIRSALMILKSGFEPEVNNITDANGFYVGDRHAAESLPIAPAILLGYWRVWV